jgi:DNA-binding MarR family transcriptional regulator
MRNISDKDILRDVEELSGLLLELGRKKSLRDPVSVAVEQMQFTPAQIHALLWLGTEGGLTMGDLAARLCITEKTITGVVDRLEAEGYVHRERSASDRRVVRALLTKKGTAVQQRLADQLRTKMGRLMSLLDSDERKSLLRIVRKLLERTTAEAAA